MSWKVASKISTEHSERENSCSECGQDIFFDANRGLTVCEKCGLVHSENHIDSGPEWRAYNSDQKKNRVRTGTPMTLMIHDRGLSTTIDIRNKDIFGKEIPAKMRSQIHRLRMWQSRIRVSNATERNLTFALSELDRMASSLDLQKNLREAAAKIYRDAVEKHLIRGRSIEGIAAASLYAACRRFQIPRTLNEISEVSRVEKKVIGRCFRFIITELFLHLNPSKASDFLTRFISELRLSTECQKIAKKILNEAERRGLTSGRSPVGLCAASIYAASIIGRERRTQKQIAHIAGVTEVTVRNRLSELVENLKLSI